MMPLPPTRVECAFLDTMIPCTQSPHSPLPATPLAYLALLEPMVLWARVSNAHWVGSISRCNILIITRPFVEYQCLLCPLSSVHARLCNNYHRTDYMSSVSAGIHQLELQCNHMHRFAWFFHEPTRLQVALLVILPVATIPPVAWLAVLDTKHQPLARLSVQCAILEVTVQLTPP
jgi:hypothetical protein